MRTSPAKGGLLLTCAASLLLAGCTGATQEPTPTSGPTAGGATAYTTREVTDGTTTFTAVDNPNGGTVLSFGSEAAFKLLDEQEGGFTYAFKDMNGNGKLDLWEDWRKPYRERAADLAPQLSTEQIAGLMLFSPSEYAPSDGLTDAQRRYLGEDDLRLVLSAGNNKPTDNVTWSNQIQAFVESLATAGKPYIPANLSTDPRSDATGGYAGTATPDISMWPGNLGLAATFDPAVTRQFAEIAGQEYRALGITNILGPQVDVATDPRWTRNNGTFGEDADLSTEMTKAYVQGFQTNRDGGDTVPISTTIKHFAGDSAGEGGRPSYYDNGKYAVYPGNNHATHLKPFLGSLDAMGAMASYAILVDGKGEALYGDKAVGSAFSKELIDILRKDNSYDGVIMTDWGVTAGGPADPDASWYTSWGVENETVEQRHFLVLLSGIDMFGGNTEVEPVLAAHELWQKAYEAGQVDLDADARFVQSAERILAVIFASGLYENPFLDLEHSKTVAGSEANTAAGFEAQKRSVVVLKNSAQTIKCNATTADWTDKKVYIPGTHGVARIGLLQEGEMEHGPTLDLDVAKKYFADAVTDDIALGSDGKVTGYTVPDLSEVDVVMVGMKNPISDGDGYNAETGEYLPLTLQYRPYAADSDSVRKVSIAGNTLKDGTRENRSYFGKTGYATNEADLDALERAVAAVKATGRDIPIITVLRARNPIVPTEVEPLSDALVVGFDISQEALIEVALGLHDGTGRLPITFPASMETVEASFEDVAGDVDAYQDAAGNRYGFGFGLTCEGKPIG